MYFINVVNSTEIYYFFECFRPADLYHTCYSLSGLSVAQNFSSTKPPLIIGNPNNEVQMIHPLYNIAPTSVLKAYKYAREHMKETEDELIGDNIGYNTEPNGNGEDEQETGISITEINSQDMDEPIA